METLKELKLISADPNIWKRSDAKTTFKEIKSIETKINDFNKLIKLQDESLEILNFIQL